MDWDDGELTKGPAVVGPPAKRPNKDPMPLHRPSPEQYAAMMAAAQASGQPLPRHIHHLNGKPKIAQLTRSASGRKQVISWMDAPDDVYFKVNETNKKARKIYSTPEIRRAARKPWRNLPNKNDLQVVVLD